MYDGSRMNDRSGMAGYWLGTGLAGAATQFWVAMGLEKEDQLWSHTLAARQDNTLPQIHSNCFQSGVLFSSCPIFIVTAAIKAHSVLLTWPCASRLCREGGRNGDDCQLIQERQANLDPGIVVIAGRELLWSRDCMWKGRRNPCIRFPIFGVGWWMNTTRIRNRKSKSLICGMLLQEDEEDLRPDKLLNYHSVPTEIADLLSCFLEYTVIKKLSLAVIFLVLVRAQYIMETAQMPLYFTVQSGCWQHCWQAVWEIPQVQ